jgi:hypothetical protein
VARDSKGHGHEPAELRQEREARMTSKKLNDKLKPLQTEPDRDQPSREAEALDPDSPGRSLVEDEECIVEPNEPG